MKNGSSGPVVGRKLISSDEARPKMRQHRVPCSDCPFRRDSLPGWLGGKPAENFIRMAIGEVIYPCHVNLGQQCAGMTVFRANICKDPRNPDALRLPKDKTTVFAWPTEFLDHHKEKVCESSQV